MPAGRIGSSCVGQLAGVDLGRGVALEPDDVLGVGEPGVSVSSVPNTVGRPAARAASAKRTMP